MKLNAIFFLLLSAFPTLLTANQFANTFVTERTRNNVVVSNGEPFVANDSLSVRFFEYCESPDAANSFFGRVYWVNDCTTDILYDEVIVTVHGWATAHVSSTATRDPQCSDVHVRLKIFKSDNATQIAQSDIAWFAGD